MNSPFKEIGNWSTIYYRDRRLLSLTICLILVAGLAALFVLPRMEDPALAQRVAIVHTLYPGANATRVETLVTDVIESKVQEIEEIKELRSVSRNGISTITIELKDSVLRHEVENVWSRLRDKISDAEPALPDGARNPEFDELNITAYALIVALTWDLEGEPNYAILRRHAEELDDRLSAISGTKEVDVFGDPHEEILVTLRQAELTQRGLSVTDVAAQLRSSDAKVSAGLQRGRSDDFLIEIGDEFDSLARIRRTPIQLADDGQSVALGDIAHVRKSVRTPLSSQALVDGRPAVVVAAIVLPNKRVDIWFDDARETLAAFERTLPKGVGQNIRFEQDVYVRGRLTTLSWNLLMGAAAVVSVIGVIMGWRSAMVVGISLPLASLMVLAGMNFLGVPLHQMSITGLIIALGLLIDNAIVIVDEVEQKIRSGLSPISAVKESVTHLAVPLLGSTVTTALSFAPIALMPGPAGEFVGSIAISVLLAIFSSFLLAMTVTPAIAALFRPKRERQPSERRWYRDGIHSQRAASIFHSVLTWLYRKPLVGIAASLVLPVVGFGLGTTLTEQFFPPADRDQINIQLELSPTSSLANTRATVEAARKLILEHEQVQRVDWYLGESAPSFYYNLLANRRGVSQYAQALVQLRDKAGAKELIHRLQLQLDVAFPSARFLVRQLEQGPPFEAPIEIRVSGPDLDRLRVIGNQVRKVLTETPDVVHVTTDLGETLPTLSLDVDEEKARLAGVDQMEIAQQLEASLEGAVGGLVLEETEVLPVRVRSNDDVRADLERITSLQVMSRTDDGVRRSIPVSILAEAKFVSKVSAVPRFDTQRINEVRGYITAGKLPADVLQDFRNRFEQTGFALPEGYTLVYAGESSKRNEAVGNLMSSVGVLAVLMVATLVLSFSSYRIAAIIGAVAFCSVGLSLGALATYGYPFGFMAIVGTMGLIGVAINDTIVVLAAIREDESARVGHPEAIAGVVLKCTRHVLATTLTTIVGFIPLLIGGGGFWPPLATAIAGGVAGATIMALFFGPSCYVLLMCRNCRETSLERSEITEAELPYLQVT